MVDNIANAQKNEIHAKKNTKLDNKIAGLQNVDQEAKEISGST